MEFTRFHHNVYYSWYWSPLLFVATISPLEGFRRLGGGGTSSTQSEASGTGAERILRLVPVRNKLQVAQQQELLEVEEVLVAEPMLTVQEEERAALTEAWEKSPI